MVCIFLVWLMLKVRMISLTSLLPSNQSGTPLRTNLDKLKKEPIHSFHAWFVAYQSNVMMKTMITPVRQRAGLGTPPDPFYTNQSESINRELKRVVDRRPCKLSLFIEMFPWSNSRMIASPRLLCKMENGV